MDSSPTKTHRHPQPPAAVSARAAVRNVFWLLLVGIIVLALLFPARCGHHCGSTGSAARSETSLARPLAPARKLRGLSCISVYMSGNRQAGIGSVIRLNQLAIFLASYYNVKLQYPGMTSIHGYTFGDFFSDCAEDFSKNKPPDGVKAKGGACTLYDARVLVDVCTDRPDCECLAEQVHEHIAALVKKGCRGVYVAADRYRTNFFSGCLSALTRYFGRPAPKWEYDAMHYRMGDLAEEPGSKSFTMHELWYLVREMCRRSRRDIVIITQGKPEIPPCPDDQGGAGRIVLAADTSIPHAFGIMQHAKTVAVGHSSFGLSMLELARPERMVVSFEKAGWVEWVPCEKWTLVSSKGAPFHFRNKKDMVYYAFSSRLWDSQKDQCGNCVRFEINWFNATVPKRKWAPEMMGDAWVGE